MSGLTFRYLIHFEFIFLYGVRKCSNFILLHRAVQFFQHHLLKVLSFFHCIFLPPFSKIRCPWVHGFIFGLSILLYWSIFLFLCQYHTVVITVALYYSLKSERLIPYLRFSFLRLHWLFGISCVSIQTVKFFCSSSVKNAIGNLIRIALNLQVALGSKVVFHNIESSNPRAWYVSECLCHLYTLRKW